MSHWEESCDCGVSRRIEQLYRSADFSRSLIQNTALEREAAAIELERELAALPPHTCERFE